MDAVAQVEPAAAPKISEITAMAIRATPYRTMTSMVHPACISLTRLAITKGIAHSRMTSTVTNSGVRIEAFLYSRMLRAKTFIICGFPPLP